jgi:hypothetical protein
MTPLQIYTSDGHLMQYFTSFHVAVMCFTGNEMFPKTNFELALASFFIFIAYMTNAYLFGEMAVLVRIIIRKERYYSKQLDESNRAMENILMPKVIQEQIHDYLKHNQSKAD